MASSPYSARRLVFMLALTALIFMTLDVRGTGPFGSARSMMLTASAGPRSAVAWALSPLVDGWQGAVHFDELEEENAALRAQLAELEAELAEVPDNEAELEALRAATNVEFADQFDRVSGQVVSDRQTGLERLVEINLGSDDLVEVGMPVVTASGLVGRIESVSGGRSVVLLISDPRLSVGVISTQSRIVGVTRGRGEGEDLVLDLLNNAADQAFARTRFETSGFESSPYPGGIPVGRLVEVDGSTRLEPSADIERLSFLTVILYRPDDFSGSTSPDGELEDSEDDSSQGDSSQESSSQGSSSQGSVADGEG